VKRHCPSCGGKMKFKGAGYFLTMRARYYTCTKCGYMEWDASSKEFKREKQRHDTPARRPLQKVRRFISAAFGGHRKG
jgi:Predicted DNA-binding protein containing a Zn-ribbon domain